MSTLENIISFLLYFAAYDQIPRANPQYSHSMLTDRGHPIADRSIPQDLAVGIFRGPGGVFFCRRALSVI